MLCSKRLWEAPINTEYVVPNCTASRRIAEINRWIDNFKGDSGGDGSESDYVMRAGRRARWAKLGREGCLGFGCTW